MHLFNFHTHTCFCDGSDEPLAYVEEAVRKRFTALGFSGHAPIPIENSFAIKDKYLGKFCDTIRALQTKFADKIKIFLALELDYIPGLSQEFSFFKKLCRLDYTIGSVHLIPNTTNDRIWFIDGPKTETYDQGLKELFDGDINRAVTAYYEQIIQMIFTQKPDIIGHIDKIKMHNQDRFFTEDEKWYQELVDKTLKIIQTKGNIMEVNTRGIYKKRSYSLFPGQKILEKAYMLGIPVTISSDAHKPSELDSCFDIALQTLKDIGYKRLSVYDSNGWKSIDIREFASC